jgi:hypothetical protein
MRDQDSDDIKKLLEHLGFTVHSVPEATTEKRPDLVATSGGSRMFVEVKTRVQDSKLRADMEAVPVGETKPILTPLEKHPTLSAEIKDANEQLRTMAAANDYRLLWFRASNDLFVHGARDQIISTLLGIRVVDATRDGNRRPVRCAYAGFADFYRFREIDGTIVEKGNLLTLILNRFSERYAAFKGSHICKVLPSTVIVDVAQADQDGDCYVVDGSVNRYDDEAVLAFLRAKYPQDSFHEFLSHNAGTTVTVIDARSGRLPDKRLQPDQPPIVND